MRFIKTISVVLITLVIVFVIGCKKEKNNVIEVVVEHHEYVDLGLPSGTLWAKCNIGADNPEDFGDYFAWGETLTKEIYDWKQYKYSVFEEDSYKLNKYCTDPSCGFGGFVDNLTVLESGDDVARAEWGENWRMPTSEEFNELYQNTTFVWTEINGVYGRLLTGSNGNSIFMPATGFRLDDQLICTGLGVYWSSSLQTDCQVAAWSLHFDDVNCHVCGTYERSRGQVVRAVSNNRP